MSQKKSWSLGLLTMMGAILGGVLYLSAAEQEEPPPPTPTLKRVLVAEVEAIREEREVRFPGITRAARRARMAFSVSGRLAVRPVEIGDRVAAGEMLARLDERRLQNAVDAARGQLDELAARRVQGARDRDRVRQLHAARAATAEELEKAEAALDGLGAGEEAARARLAEAERQLAEAVLRAPYAGTVTEVFLEPGEWAHSGTRVLSLAGDGEVEIEVGVPESVIRGLRPGDPARVDLPIAGLPMAGAVIKSVGRTAGGAGFLFPVVATLEPHPDLLPGMTAELALRLAAAKGLALPVEAVVDPGGRRPAVYRVSQSAGGPSTGGPSVGGSAVQQVEKLAVEVGALLGERVVVQGPLTPGDRVVVGGQRGLLDGESVEVARHDEAGRQDEG